MADKRSTNVDPELRLQKRARTFPISHDNCDLTASPAAGVGDKSGLHRSSTTPLAHEDSQNGREVEESEAWELAASPVEDTAQVEVSEEPLQGCESPGKDIRTQENASSSHSENGEDENGVTSLARQTLEGCTGPHDNSEPYSGSTATSKDNASPETELKSEHPVEEPVSASNSPLSDTRVQSEQSKPWNPPPEPLRPENPYTKGLSLTIYRHEACPPFGQDYAIYTDLRDRVLEKDLRRKTLVDLCLEHPPMEGQTDYEDSRKLEVVEELRVKSDGGAQLVVCHLDDDDQDYVAKIYDPLYYGFSDTMWPDLPRDVTFESDMDYCREVAAYEEMDEWVGGTDVPKFHGSCTFQVPLSLPTGPRMRDVRMILIERVPGKSMLEYNQDKIPESERLETLARMSELISRISFIGVHHHDISQRNIMVCDGEDARKVGRIVLIDFNMSTVERLDNFEEQYGPREPGPDKPPNPLDRWWGGGWYGGFWEWLPERWEKRLRPLQEWMYERWGSSEDFAPPVRDLVWDEENQPRSWIAW